MDASDNKMLIFDKSLNDRLNPNTKKGSTFVLPFFTITRLGNYILLNLVGYHCPSDSTHRKYIPCARWLMSIILPSCLVPPTFISWPSIARTLKAEIFPLKLIFKKSWTGFG